MLNILFKDCARSDLLMDPSPSMSISQNVSSMLLDLLAIFLVSASVKEVAIISIETKSETEAREDKSAKSEKDIENRYKYMLVIAYSITQ